MMKNEESFLPYYGTPAQDTGQVAIMDGLINQAKDRNWAVTTANANSDSETQVSQMDYILSLGVDAIVTVLVNSEGICESVKKGFFKVLSGKKLGTFGSII